MMNEYRFRTDIPKEEYEQFVQSHQLCNLLQSYDWAKVKNNWDHVYAGVYDKNKLAATGLILIKPLPFSFTMFYLPKGPILDYTNKELFNFFFENLKKLAKQKHCVFIKFDPGIVIRELSLHKEVLNAHTDTQSILADIKAIGGIHKGFTTYIEETVQPRFHMGLYPCELKEHLPSSTLRSIKKAQKKNVVVEEAGVQGLDEFAQIMHMTEERKQVHLRGKDYFELLLRTYPKNARLFLAYVDPKQKMQTLLEKKKQLEDIIAERPNKKKEHELLQTNEEIDSIKTVCEKYPGRTAIAGGIMIGYGKECEMLYAGSNDDFMNFRPQYLLYLTQFEYAFSHGYEFVTMGGIDGDFKDGLSQFKSNFNPVIREYIGEFDLPIHKIMYAAANKLLPSIKKLLKNKK